MTERISWARKTMYSDGLWKTEVRQLASTHSGADSTADTAYTSLPIAPHNDTCYLEDPCGLQVFHAIRTAEGGESQLVDTYSVCEALRNEHPDTFAFFSTTRLPFRFQDDACDYLQLRPVIQVDRGHVVSFRFNDCDRSELSLSFEECDEFYGHLRTLLTYLRDERFVFTFKLAPGMVMFVQNQRTLHGRTGFDADSDRCLAGVYIGKDEWMSRLRVLERRFKD